VVQEPIEGGRGNGAITVKDSGPLFEGLVGGDDDRTTFVALADNLEQQVDSVAFNSFGQIAQELQSIPVISEDRYGEFLEICKSQSSTRWKDITVSKTRTSLKSFEAMDEYIRA